MPSEVTAPPGADANSGQPPSAGSRLLRVLRGMWPWLLAAVALLGASEILWLWHSWPVREVLETEQRATGVPSI